MWFQGDALVPGLYRQWCPQVVMAAGSTLPGHAVFLISDCLWPRDLDCSLENLFGVMAPFPWQLQWVMWVPPKPNSSWRTQEPLCSWASLSLRRPGAVQQKGRTNKEVGASKGLSMRVSLTLGRRRLGKSWCSQWQKEKAAGACHHLQWLHNSGTSAPHLSSVDCTSSLRGLWKECVKGCYSVCRVKWMDLVWSQILRGLDGGSHEGGKAACWGGVALL